MYNINPVTISIFIVTNKHTKGLYRLGRCFGAKRELERNSREPVIHRKLSQMNGNFEIVSE